MKGEEFLALRKRTGLGRSEFMFQLGYCGNKNTMSTLCRRYERGKKPIPLHIARYVWMFANFVSKYHALPEFPEWPGYEQEIPQDAAA